MNIKQIPLKEISLHPDRTYRQSLSGVEKIAKSMAKPHGQLQAIGIDQESNLIWGLQRLEAAKRLGWTEITARVVDLDNPHEATQDENESRTEYTMSERVAVAKAVEEMEKSKAKDRQKKHGGTAPGKGKNTCGNITTSDLDSGEDTKSREKAADAIGVSGKTYESMKKIEEHGTEELKKAVDAGDVSKADAAKIADKPPEVQHEAIKAKKEGKAKTVAKAAKEIEAEQNGKHEEPEEAPKDRYGDEWPERCLPHVIDATKELNTFRLSIVEITKESRRLNNTKAANHVDFSGITHSLEQIKTLCNAGRPDYICPYCDGTGKDKDRMKCKPCKGDGWVNASIYDNTEKASKRKRA